MTLKYQKRSVVHGPWGSVKFMKKGVCELQTPDGRVNTALFRFAEIDIPADGLKINRFAAPVQACSEIGRTGMMNPDGVQDKICINCAGDGFEIEIGGRFFGSLKIDKTADSFSLDRFEASCKNQVPVDGFN